MNASRIVVSLLLLCAGGAAPLAAQLLPGVSLSVEARPLYAAPAGEFGSAAEGIGASGGPGIAAGGMVGFGPLGVYGEYQYTRFGCGECADVGLEDRLEDQGWEAGVELGLPLPGLGLRPWARAGVIGHQLVFAGTDGSLVSEPGTGFAAGGGLDLGVGPLHVLPAVRYRNYSAEFTFEELELPSRETDVSYLTLELGAAFRF